MVPKIYINELTPIDPHSALSFYVRTPTCTTPAALIGLFKGAGYALSKGAGCLCEAAAFRVGRLFRPKPPHDAALG